MSKNGRKRLLKLRYLDNQTAGFQLATTLNLKIQLQALHMTESSLRVLWVIWHQIQVSNRLMLRPFPCGDTSRVLIRSLLGHRGIQLVANPVVRDLLPTAAWSCKLQYMLSRVLWSRVGSLQLNTPTSTHFRVDSMVVLSMQKAPMQHLNLPASLSQAPLIHPAGGSM